MGKKEKLVEKARASSSNLRFDEGIILAQAYGFVLSRTGGSHHLLVHEGLGIRLNFQRDKRDPSKLKAYQVRQLLSAIDQISASE